MIRFNCSSCGKLVQVADLHAGKKGKCPHCRTLMEIPQASAAEAAAAAKGEPTVAESPTPASEATAPPAPALRADEAPQDKVAAPPGFWDYAACGQRHGPVDAPAPVAQIQAGQ